MTAKVAALVGPTAVGKTGVSVALAKRLNAEIVSVDSMQIYRGMDIGTDKVPAELRADVAHHLIDESDPSEPLTVAEFQQRARSAIDDISARGHLPLLVGGSGLYFRAVVDELRFPPRSREVRVALETQAEAVGARALHERLATLDPSAAARIEPSNARRTIRALEVIELTGRPFSDNDDWDRYESRYDLVVAGLQRPRAELYARVAERVARMLERGLVDETLALQSRGLSPTARQALGYRQILEMPAASVEELQAEIARATKRFARRQDAWFRADPRIRWFEASSTRLVDDLVDFFRQQLRLP